MRCREVKQTLIAYLDGEVMPSERTLIDAHLATCESCRRELASLSSCRSRLSGSLTSLAADAAPPELAWCRLQARLAAEARTHRQGEKNMKLRWRVALGTAGALVLAVAIIAAVPSTRAAAGDFFAEVFRIEAKPLQLGYLPVGFDAMPVYQVGSVSVEGGEVSTAGTPGVMQRDEQALYTSGDLFLLVRTSSDIEAALPSGQEARVNGEAAVLQTGLSGTLDAPPGPGLPESAPAPDGAGAEPGTSSAVAGAGPTAVTGRQQSGYQVAAGGGEGPSLQSDGVAPEIPTITYDDASSLTWTFDGTRVEMLTNLPVEELLKIAEGLVLED